ncbi:putative two-component hybrid sensor and regulator [Sphingomonas changbaiensis NBRC 104936]|uniref:histidine kinase n=1 Tax=Sphingomonas changbaiensis NBRC 104936 TaxID=1219043 RepID=A0A0E9MMH3_9SPHN|nr:CHASE domain-containing protein [Sphingomonas changbaiensis]GAO38708.1 putative two-component hybrid sensor and regulator [Sphingomonas changbaiensis NBRC 104936]
MQRSRRDLIPLLVFLLGLAASLAAAAAVSHAEAARRSARFEALADNAVGAINARMLAQLTLLRATAGFFKASDDVRSDEFRNFVARLRLDRYYPGVLGIGYAAYLPDKARVAAFERQASALGFPDLRVWPPGTRRDYSAIEYLEPLDRRNRSAIGYDMLSEPTRREAMDAARKGNTARVSGRVRLVQEIDPVKQPGFLIYLALFDNGGSGAEPRHLLGWVYSPLRAYDLFNATFAGNDLSQLTVEIFDVAANEDQLLFRSGPVQARPSVQRIRRIDTVGRTWIVRLTSTPRFDQAETFPLPIVVAGGGALISLLVAILMLQQQRATARTEDEVALRTAELRDANARLIDEGSARAEAEAQVRQMQKMEAIGQLTGGIAHDFNNMLAIIIGNIDLAERRADDPDRVRRAVGHAREGAIRAAQLTQRLLAFGRRQPLAPRAMDANALILGMAELLHRALGKGIRLETVLADGLWRCFADPAQLENAIVNLAINARDATPDGGTVTIATANLRRSADTPAGSSSASDFVSITVRDTGHGMPEEVAARAFEPFFTTKDVGRGTGLGLSQVYGFVTQSGGTLELISAPERGTTIVILLPRDQKSEASPPEAPARDEGVPTGRADEVILVVEDEDQVRRITVETLCELGYSVLEASGGEEALSVIEKKPEIALLLTDIVMPGMNGRRLASLVRQQRPELPILYATGYAPEELRGSDEDDGDIPTLRKPFQAGQVARAVRQALDG